MTIKIPKVFISYSWDNEDHKEWVRNLADKLRENGVDVDLDQYDLSPGDRLPKFMEEKITNSDFVLIVCTENYKIKADNRKSGVGYEGHIISSELFSKNNDKKFIPIVKNNFSSDILPVFLSGKLGIPLLEDIDTDENSFNDLLATLFQVQVKKKPKLGDVPNFISKSAPKEIEKIDSQDIRIEGIITNEVTVPKMDGTRGSALYKIPFQLNNEPSQLWTELFLRNWQAPPRFTLMHRPSIARVVGHKIILDGTTIEEVKEYHRDTLKLCVEKANQDEQMILEKQRIKQEKENERIANHYDKIAQFSEDITF